MIGEKLIGAMGCGSGRKTNPVGIWFGDEASVVIDAIVDDLEVVMPIGDGAKEHAGFSGNGNEFNRGGVGPEGEDRLDVVEGMGINPGARRWGNIGKELLFDGRQVCGRLK